MSKPIVLVVSSGRCGTKFVADVLQSVCGVGAEVWHERVSVAAFPRRYFRHYDSAKIQEYLQVPAVRSMVDDIRRTVRHRP